MKTFKFVLFTNTFNPHMKPLADELFNLLGDNFVFIAFDNEIDDERKRLGWSNQTSKYLVHYFDDCKYSESLIADADIVYFGANPNMFSYIKKRIYSKKITFFHMERILKHGIIQFLIPKYTFYFIEQRIKPSNMSNVFFLGCSSYLVGDLKKIKANTNNVYKFGYFPVFYKTNPLDIVKNKSNSTFVFLAVGRLIKLKHFDNIIKSFSVFLKNIENVDCNEISNRKYILKIIGSGEQKEKLINLSNRLNISNNVVFVDSLSPELVREEMKMSHVFVASSDKREGWGAVINEAMNSCCAVIASKEMGSVSFLIEDGINGFVFKNGNINELSSKMIMLANDCELRCKISINAYRTIETKWNPFIAAKRLCDFSTSLLSNDCYCCSDGPLSK